MGTGLITVKKEFEGKVFSSSHGWADTLFNGVVDETQVDTLWSQAEDLTDPAQTEPGQTGYIGDTALLAAIVAYERLMTDSECTIVEVVISDGFTPGTDTGPFATIPVNVKGLLALANVNLAPLSTCLLIRKAADITSHKGGRLYMRASLYDTQVEASGGRYGIQIVDSLFAGIKTRCDNAFTSTMAEWAGPITLANPIRYAIPTFAAEAGQKSKRIVGGVPLKVLSVAGAVSHQVVRGRKRKTA